MFLCKKGVCENFDVSEDAPEIVLCASDRRVPGATRGSLVPGDPGSCFRRLLFDGVDALIMGAVAEWFPEGTFWFWIEY